MYNKLAQVSTFPWFWNHVAMRHSPNNHPTTTGNWWGGQTEWDFMDWFSLSFRTLVVLVRRQKQRLSWGSSLARQSARKIVLEILKNQSSMGLFGFWFYLWLGPRWNHFKIVLYGLQEQIQSDFVQYHNNCRHLWLVGSNCFCILFCKSSPSSVPSLIGNCRNNLQWFKLAPNYFLLHPMWQTSNSVDELCTPAVTENIYMSKQIGS